MGVKTVTRLPKNIGEFFSGFQVMITCAITCQKNSWGILFFRPFQAIVAFVTLPVGNFWEFNM